MERLKRLYPPSMLLVWRGSHDEPSRSGGVRGPYPQGSLQVLI